MHGIAGFWSASFLVNPYKGLQGSSWLIKAIHGSVRFHKPLQGIAGLIKAYQGLSRVLGSSWVITAYSGGLEMWHNCFMWRHVMRFYFRCASFGEAEVGIQGGIVGESFARASGSIAAA